MQHYDLNLLIALEALLEEGSVSKAAERLNLSAAATSHALGRLRTAMGDPLLVRAGQTLVPTPRAIAIRDNVRAVVENGRAILRDQVGQELANVRRSLNVRADDSMISIFGAVIANHVQAEAPGIQIRFSGRANEDVTALRNGSVDLDIGVDAEVGPEISTQQLMDDHFVGTVRAGHPLAKGRLTMTNYANANHVVSSRRGRAQGPVDSILGKAGHSRRVAVIVPDTLAAIAVAATSDYLATVPKAVAEWGRTTMNLRILSLPFAPEPITLYQSWHPRLEHDSAHRWLRECMLRVVGGV